MALALCPRPAHLYVLKLSSELHGGGTGSVETSVTLRSALLLARLRPSNTSTNQNSRKIHKHRLLLTSLNAEGPVHIRVQCWTKYSRHKAKHSTYVFNNLITNSAKMLSLLNSMFVSDCQYNMNCRQTVLHFPHPVQT